MPKNQKQQMQTHTKKSHKNVEHQNKPKTEMVSLNSVPADLEALSKAVLRFVTAINLCS